MSFGMDKPGISFQFQYCGNKQLTPSTRKYTLHIEQCRVDRERLSQHREASNGPLHQSSFRPVLLDVVPHLVQTPNIPNLHDYKYVWLSIIPNITHQCPNISLPLKNQIYPNYSYIDDQTVKS